MRSYTDMRSSWKCSEKIIYKEEIMSRRELIEAYAMEHGEDEACVMEEFMDYLSEMEEEENE